MSTPVTTIHDEFKAVAQMAKAINSKGAGLWSSLAKFALAHASLSHEVLNDVIKAQMRAVNNELRVDLGKNSTFKVSKSVIVRARELGVSLTDKAGKVRGKTEVEQDIKALTEGPTPAE